MTVFLTLLPRWLRGVPDFIVRLQGCVKDIRKYVVWCKNSDFLTLEGYPSVMVQEGEVSPQTVSSIWVDPLPSVISEGRRRQGSESLSTTPWRGWVEGYVGILRKDLRPRVLVSTTVEESSDFLHGSLPKCRRHDRGFLVRVTIERSIPFVLFRWASPRGV